MNTIQRFPKLYKRSKTGAIQEWEISVYGNSIAVTHGQVGGALQTLEETIQEGKNVGKRNETTPEQQAYAEAQARHTKQLKKGYVDSLESAKAGETDAVITGGILPMLAHVYDDHKHKLAYPLFIQPKLDGTRCLAVWDGSDVTLWTRTRKPITSVPHIVEDLKKGLSGRDPVTLDGELYNHELKHDFEELVSIIRQTNKVHPDHTKVQYHIYDLVSAGKQFERLEELEIIHDALDSNSKGSSLWTVETIQARNAEDLEKHYSYFLDSGYEGAMARNFFGLYIHSRSYDLQKIKTFVDREFIVIDVEEGRGKLAGHGIFVCEVGPGGKRFTCKMEGPLEHLKEVFENRGKYIGRALTVKYQNYSKYGLPRFPIGLRFRDDG